eukprot:333985_1
MAYSDCTDLLRRRYSTGTMMLVPVPPKKRMPLNENWIAFDGPINVTYGTIVSVNDNEFIIASQHKTQNDGHIYKFNIHQKEWRKFAEYPKYANISHPNLAFNKDT